MVVALLGFTVEGARFIFGDLVYNNVPMGLGEAGSNAPIQEVPGQVARTGASFAFNVLPTIIFFSSLMTVLYHMGVMQWVVKGVAWVMQKTLGTSGAETLSAAGNIFVGQTEAPLMIKPFFEKMTMSELHAVMTGGFATVAGGVLAAYVGMLLAYFPDIAGHLIAASVMSAPAALVMAKLMYPEDGEPVTKGQLEDRAGKPRRERHRRGGPGGRGGVGVGLERGGHAPGLHRPHRHGQRAPGVGGWLGGAGGSFLPADSGVDPGTPGLVHGSAVGGCRDRGLPPGNQDGGQRVRGLPGAFFPPSTGRELSSPGRSSSPSTLCRASPTSPPSPSNWEASGAWLPPGGMISPGWDSGPWWPAPWRLS